MTVDSRTQKRPRLRRHRHPHGHPLRWRRVFHHSVSVGTIRSGLQTAFMPTPVPTLIPTAYMDGLTVVALNASSNSTCTFVAAAAAVVANTQCVSPTGLCSFQAASSVTVPAKCTGLDANNNTCQLAANGTSCSD